LVSVGTVDAGGIGDSTRVAVRIFEFCDLVSVCEDTVYPVFEVHMLGETRLSHVKPVSMVQVLEHPSPPKELPSSHCLTVPLGIVPLPQITVQTAVLLTAL
jgi:hypothetical protein